MSVRSQLLLAIAYPLLVAIVSLAVPLSLNVHDRVSAEVRDQASVAGRPDRRERRRPRRAGRARRPAGAGGRGEPAGGRPRAHRGPQRRPARRQRAVRAGRHELREPCRDPPRAGRTPGPDRAALGDPEREPPRHGDADRAPRGSRRRRAGHPEHAGGDRRDEPLHVGHRGAGRDRRRTRAARRHLALRAARPAGTEAGARRRRGGRGRAGHRGRPQRPARAAPPRGRVQHDDRPRRRAPGVPAALRGGRVAPAADPARRDAVAARARPAGR